jgi:chorismate mutase
MRPSAHETIPSCRGIRGATTAKANTGPAVAEAAADLLRRLFAANGVRPEDVGCILFTATPDLDAAFPARGARSLGLPWVPLLCSSEIAVPGDVPRCIRVLILWNTPRDPRDVVHVYVRGAKGLREYGEAGMTAPGRGAPRRRSREGAGKISRPTLPRRKV